LSKERIEVKPVTRIEGSMKVAINLDDAGNVKQAHANVLEFRGFEAFLHGRHVSRVPMITPRICGVCPVPHHLASVKAIETGLGIEPPETAKLLRELMLMAEHAGDHILHIFVLAGPDILLSDLQPEQRGLVTLYGQYPNVVKEVLAIREVTQSIVSALGVQAVHPATGIPGGMTKHLNKSDRDRFLEGVKQAKDTILKFHDDVLIPKLEQALKTYAGLGRLNTNFAGLVKQDNLEFYDGVIRIVEPEGETLSEFNQPEYLNYIAEKDLDYTYAKAAYLLSQEPSTEIYRAGPIARINVAKSATTEHANAYMQEFKSMFGDVAQETLALNLARYICMVYAIERAEQLLENEKIIGKETMSPVKYVAGEGVGIVEAPRGLLVHHFRWDDDGYITMANIITPTNANSYAIDASLKKVAERSIKAGEVDETRLEHEIGLAVRAYDPCLSCATHALSFDTEGSFIEVVDTEGNHRWI
jgi:F420-non-reducing hydrogenase large subunit